MANLLKNVPSIVFSLAVHAVVFVVLMMIPLAIQGGAPEILLESIFTEDVPRDELEQELSIETKPAESLNIIAGGTPSTAIGASAQPVSAPVNVQDANVMQEVNIRPVLMDVALPSDEVMGAELGEGEVTGEVGAMVEGYGSAMGIITKEIIRMMRQKQVTVIWLFDESGSLTDDRKEIRENYMRVYDELGIAAQQDRSLRGSGQQLLTVVASYGASITEHTRPTSNIDQIKQAIDKIQIDQSGQENMCRSIATVINNHHRKTRGLRKLAVIVVSDEAGDDGDYVEEAIGAARNAKVPVYVMGRESMFGFPYARQRWVHEPSGEAFWIQIRRGPETAFPECLQWDGMHTRWDRQSAGFGPYEQVRIARETGGIFFVLPGNEENLVGKEINEQRKYDFLSMREYQPLLLSRREYYNQRSVSPFRETLWRVILRLNPSENKLLFESHDPELNLRREHYPIMLADFKTEAGRQVQKADRSMSLVNEAIGLLEGVKPLRAQESSQRWRAGYDLALAQLYVFRLRLFQYLLYMDQHANNMPKPQNPKSNEWNFWQGTKTITPDEAQFDRLKRAFRLPMERDEYLAMVQSEEKKAIGLLDEVVQNHPGTPWAARATQEKRDGFGFVIAERHWDPSGIRASIIPQLPKL